PLPRPLSASASAPAGWGREGAWAVCTARRRRGREETRSKTTKSERERPRGRWSTGPRGRRLERKRGAGRLAAVLSPQARAAKGGASGLSALARVDLRRALTRQASIRCRGPRRRTLRHRAWHVEAWQDAKDYLVGFPRCFYRLPCLSNSRHPECWVGMAAELATRSTEHRAQTNVGCWHTRTSGLGHLPRAGTDWGGCSQRFVYFDTSRASRHTHERTGSAAEGGGGPTRRVQGESPPQRARGARDILAQRSVAARRQPARAPTGGRGRERRNDEERKRRRKRRRRRRRRGRREERGERREVSLRRASTRRVQGESPPRASSRRAGHPGPAQCGGPQAARSGIDGGRREEEERREERGGAGRERRNEEGKKACEASLRRVSTRRVQGESPPQASSRPKGNPAPRAVQRPAGSPLGHRRKEEEEKEAVGGGGGGSGNLARARRQSHTDMSDLGGPRREVPPRRAGGTAGPVPRPEKSARASERVCLCTCSGCTHQERKEEEEEEEEEEEG
ncbi:unnamed protein product, partial [Prorocentrum cordatum]